MASSPDLIKKSWSVALLNESLNDGPMKESVCIIPFNWFSKNKKTCRFPNKVSGYTLNILTEECAEPKKEWSTYPVIKLLKDQLELKAAKEEYLKSESENENENENSKKSSKRHTLPEFPVKNSHTSNKNANTALTKGDISSHGENESLLKEQNQDAAAFTKKGPSTSKESGSMSNEVTAKTKGGDLANKENELVPSNGQNPSPLPEILPSKENETLERRFLQILGVVTVQQRHLMKLQGELDGKLGPSKEDRPKEKEDSSESDDDQLMALCPFKRKEDFDKFDKKLDQSRALRKQFRQELSLYLTSDKKSSCVDLAHKILSDQVADCFTWQGRRMSNQKHPKTAFNKTRMYKVISQTVNEKFKENPLTVLEYKENLADWFTQARFRIDGKVKRKTERDAKAVRVSLEQEEIEKTIYSSGESCEENPNESEATAPKRRKKKKKSSKKGSDERYDVAHLGAAVLDGSGENINLTE